MADFFLFIPVILIVLYLVEPILRDEVKLGYLDALAIGADRHKLLKNEEVLQALTELEVDFRDERISEIDYFKAKKELSRGYDSQ